MTILSRSATLFCTLLVTLSGCGGSGGGSQTSTPPPPTTPPPSVSVNPGRTWFTAVPYPGTRQADAAFAFAGPVGVDFECDLDGAGWNACTSPQTVSAAPGTHSFRVRSAANGVSDPRPAVWRWHYAGQVPDLGDPENPFFTSGLVPPNIAFLGILTDPCEAVTTLELRNDQPLARQAELAWSGVAIPRELDLRDTGNLVLVGPGEQLTAVQFRPLARWNAPLSDTGAPIKWLEVAAVVDVQASGANSYSLRRCAAPPAVNTDTWLPQVTSNPDGTLSYDNHFIQLTFDPAAASGIGGGQVGAASLSATLQILGATGQTGVPTANSAEFLLEESGPVKTVIRTRGHVAGLSGPGCSEPAGYTLRWTLVRGSRDIGLESDFVNECGDGMYPASPGGAVNGSDWWSRTLDIASFSLRFDFGMDGNTVVTRSSGDGTSVSTAGGAGTSLALAEVAQLKGAIGNPAGSGWRWAQESLTVIPFSGGGFVTNSESHLLPVAGLSDASLTVLAQQPWMRFREPQAVGASSNFGVANASVTLSPIHADPADPFVLGEAQGVWGQGHLSINTANLNDTQLLDRAARSNAALERGLLWRAPLWSLNQAKVFPELPDPSAPEMAALTPLVEGAHDNSVIDSLLGGAQRDRMKGYSLVGWVDAMQEGIKDVLNPSLDDYAPGSNIWSPTNTELLMWFVTGDPKWVWDYALPAEWNLWKSNAYNTGSRGVVGIRSGLVIASGSVGEGARYRSGYGSDDKFYNQGSGKAYVVRPYRSLAERFQAAGDTVISRYVDAVANREETVSVRVMTRQVMQHLNALRYAAEFSPVNDSALRAKFDAMMQEYADDNLANGTFCFGDDAATNQSDCAFAPSGLFHYVALWQELFYNHALDLPPGDGRRDTILDALASTARLIDSGIPRDGGGEISDFAPTAWGNSYACDFSGGGDDIVSQCVQYNCTGLVNPGSGGCPTDPTYDNAHLNTLGTVLIGHALDPARVSDERCAEARRGFNTDLNGSTVANHLRDSGYGWHKDASQMVQTVLYAIAAGQACN